MKMHQKVNQNFSKSTLLREIAETLREEVNTINIESNKYAGCIHFTGDKPSVGVWERVYAPSAFDDNAEFEINEDTVSIINKGRYSDETVLEMLNIIQDWLNNDV